MFLELIVLPSLMLLMVFVCQVVMLYMFVKSNQRINKHHITLLKLEQRIDNNHIMSVKLQKDMCALLNSSNLFLEKIANRQSKANADSSSHKNWRGRKKEQDITQTFKMLIKDLNTDTFNALS